MISIPKVSPLTRVCMSIGALPTSYLDSMTYYEQLCWLCKYINDTVIPAVNTNAEAVTELQNLYTALKKYVDDYFENLDVQEEIDNKIDELVEDGTMDQLLNTNLTGSLSNLTTTVKTNLVAAINEVDSHADTNAASIGTLSDLTTTAKSNLVASVNEVNTKASTVGNLNSLTTTNKDNVVAAINEVNNIASGITTEINKVKITKYTFTATTQAAPSPYGTFTEYIQVAKLGYNPTPLYLTNSDLSTNCRIKSFTVQESPFVAYVLEVDYTNTHQLEVEQTFNLIVASVNETSES